MSSVDRTSPVLAGASCAEESDSPFASLPYELIEKTLSYLSLPDLLSAMGVNRQVHSIGENLPVWRDLLERAWMGRHPAELDQGEYTPYQRFWHLQNLIEQGRLSEIISTTQLLEYTRSVLCVAVTPNGEKTFLALDDNTVRVLDSANGKEIFCLRGHTGWVRSVTTTPDGRIVSGSRDRTVRVWDSANGEEIFCLRGHTGWVRSVATTPHGRIVSGSYDHTVRVWDSANGQPLACLEGHRESVRSVAITTYGTIISGSNDRTVRVWDSANRQQLACLEGHEGWVTCVAVTPDGKIVSGSDNGTIRVWDGVTGKEIFCLRGHEKWVNSIAITPDGKIISGSDDGTVRIWDSATGQPLACLSESIGWVQSVAITPDGRIIVSGSECGKVMVHAYNPKTFEQMYLRSVSASSAPADALLTSGLTGCVS